MISKKMQDAFNEQMKNEFESAWLYLSMATYFHSIGMDGMAHWMTLQAKEEDGHARKFMDHIIERQGRAVLSEIKKPQSEWASPLEAFKAAYKHEQFITGKIDELVSLAIAEKDNPAQVFLQWFVQEQVEEEDNASKIVQLLERVGDAGHAMVMVDAQLGKRE